ncbi:MAG: glycosyltransferase family 9 protein [Gammaproteobacteria bacterium]|nr:glycosyltransferase family 9 protein [Gammaproteobacteria bacterium]
MSKTRRSRLPMRLAIAAWAVRASLIRRRPREVQRILVAHNLLLGDTLMLTPLLAALRTAHPQARIVMTCSPAFLPLYRGRPYGVEAMAFDPRDRSTLAALRKAGPYDLAIVPAESRHGWLARAANARWVRGFAGDAWYYRAALDETVPYPAQLEVLADLMARLAGGPGPGTYDPRQWPAPARGSRPLAQGPYVVLHLGAGSPLKYWPTSHWQEVAASFSAKGFAVVLSAGHGQEGLAQAVDPKRRFVHLAGTLDLVELWHLFAGARLLIAPDTGVVHLAKHTRTPTVALFGPGQQALYVGGRFFGQVPLVGVTVSDMPCRDEAVLFNRRLSWVHTCVRPVSACHHGARCSTSITVDSVLAAAYTVMGGADTQPAAKPSSVDTKTSS